MKREPLPVDADPPGGPLSTDTRRAEGLVAVRPAEYWPRAATLALADQVDLFVVADTYAYSRQSYQNRCRLVNRDGPHWLSVPIAGGQGGQPACRTRIAAGPWAVKHLKSIRFDLGSAPFYGHYIDRIRRVLDTGAATLADLNVATLTMLCSALGLQTRVVRASALPGAPASLPSIIRACAAGGLVSPPQVADVEPTQSPVPTRLFRFDRRPYAQQFAGFVADAAGLDLLLNHGPGSLAVLRDRAGEASDPVR